MRRTRIAAFAAALATTVPALAAGSALAASPETFTHTGAAQTYVVPKNVRSLDVTAIGAPGGNSIRSWPNERPGGQGGIVRATVPVTPGQTLHVYVGGAGAWLFWRIQRGRRVGASPSVRRAAARPTSAQPRAT